MRKYICDRCGREYNGKSDNQLFDVSRWISDYDSRIYDLCPECEKQLDEFLKGKEWAARIKNEEKMYD